jgi:hypothetical protein
MKHRAPVVTNDAASAPPVVRVLHTGRLYIDASRHTRDTQCARVAELTPLCFESVNQKLGLSLERMLWQSFPKTQRLSLADRPAPDDYVLVVELHLEPLAPDASGPGWSAGARGRWKLLRDGKVLAEDVVAARSRAEFAYGRPLGVAAGEAIDAVSIHLATVLAQLPAPEVEPTPPPSVALTRP